MGGYENICCSLSPHHIAFCHNSVLKKSHYTLAPISTGSPQSCTVLITFTCWRYHLLVAYSVQFLTGLSPLWRKERLTEKHRNIKITFSMLFGIKMLICSNAVGHKKPLHRLLQGCHLCFFFSSSLVALIFVSEWIVSWHPVLYENSVKKLLPLHTVLSADCFFTEGNYLRWAIKLSRVINLWS